MYFEQDFFVKRLHLLQSIQEDLLLVILNIDKRNDLSEVLQNTHQYHMVMIKDQKSPLIRQALLGQRMKMMLSFFSTCPAVVMMANEIRL